MNHETCGAKTRAGTPCKRRPQRGGRCNLHGGKSYRWFAHPNYKHGWYSKYNSRSITIYMLNREGIYCESGAEYLKVLRERAVQEKKTREARFRERELEKEREMACAHGGNESGDREGV